MGQSTDPGKRRTQSERRDAARSAILETAMQLLADGGYANMTLADVGEQAGYSRSLATHYFGSKAKMLAAIIELARAESPPVTLRATGTGVERITDEINGFFDGLAAHPAWVRAYMVIAHEAATSTPELRPAIHEQNIAFRQRVECDLREDCERGLLDRSVDPTTTSIVIISMLRGIAWEWFTDASLDLAKCRRAVLEQIELLCRQSPSPTRRRTVETRAKATRASPRSRGPSPLR